MFSLSVVSDGYLLVILSGKGSLENYRAAVGFVGDLVRTGAERRVLVDMLACEAELCADEHREVGERAGRLWKAAQVAIVATRAENVVIGVDAARQAGANVRTFNNLRDAEEWLGLGA